MFNLNTESISLNNFEGPLDFLWHLIQKNELDIYEIRIQQITEQFLAKLHEKEIDNAAEFISTAACLIWLKSKSLLPKHEQDQLPQEIEEEDPKFEIIHHLIDYSRFKEAAKELSELEQKQSVFYPRGAANIDLQKNLGIEHLCLDDLASLFQQLLAKSKVQKGQVKEEIWKVSDKIQSIRQQLGIDQKILFEVIFSPDRSRAELIVTFLAVLELMKIGEARVVRELSTKKIMIITTENGERN